MELNIYSQPSEERRPVEPFRHVPPWNTVTRLILDIETTSLDPADGVVLAVGLRKDGPEGTKRSILDGGGDEAELLRQVSGILGNRDNADILIGHNVYQFDLPYLAHRARVHGIRFPYRKGERERTITASSFNGKPITFTPWRGPTPIVDTFHQAGIYDKSACSLSSLSLKVVPIELSLRAFNNRPELSAREIQESFTANRALFDEYLLADLDDTYLLAERFVPVVWAQQAWVPKLDVQELAVVSPAKKCQVILEALYPGIQPEADEKVSYPGAISKGMAAGVFEHVAKLDVASLYPSIMLGYAVTSRKDTEHRFLDVLAQMVRTRLELKAKAKAGDKQADFEQNALKILINGSYGFLGTGGYGFNDMEAAAKVTAYGREILTKMIEVADAEGAKVISVDTDGILISHPKAAKVHKTIQAAMPPGINIDIDFANAQICVPRDSDGDPMAKNYILKWPGVRNLKITGIYRKRDTSPWLKRFVTEVVTKRFTEGPMAAMHHYSLTLLTLHRGLIPSEALAVTKKISVKSKALLDLGQPGGKVTFWWAEEKRIGKNGKPLKSQKKPSNTEPYWPDHYTVELVKVWESLGLCNPEGLTHEGVTGG